MREPKMFRNNLSTSQLSQPLNSRHVSLLNTATPQCRNSAWQLPQTQIFHNRPNSANIHILLGVPPHRIRGPSPQNYTEIRCAVIFLPEKMGNLQR